MQLNKLNVVAKLIVLFLGTSLFSQCKSQEKIDWSKSSDWKLYSVRMNEFMKTPINRLPHLKSIAVDSLVPFLERATQWPKDSVAVWQSSYNTSCQIKNKVHKVVFSSYGGFFFDINSQRYYAVPEHIKRDVKSLLQQYQLQLIPE